MCPRHDRSFYIVSPLKILYIITKETYITGSKAPFALDISQVMMSLEKKIKVNELTYFDDFKNTAPQWT